MSAIMHWIIKTVLKSVYWLLYTPGVELCTYPLPPPPSQKKVSFLLQNSVLSRNYKYEHHAARRINPTRLIGRYWN